MELELFFFKYVTYVFQEEFGWKLVHGDVFRPPRRGMLLAVFLGSGSQVSFLYFFISYLFQRYIEN